MINTSKMKNLNYELSPHAVKRSSQRDISREFMNLTIKYGECVFRTGIQFFIMTDKRIKRMKKIGKELPEKIAGVVVLCREREYGVLEILTVYKNQDALKTILKKRKRQVVLCNNRYSKMAHS